jgi:hypothetical protein
MKNLFVAFLMLAFTAGPVFSQHNEWSLFSSKEANVEAMFPGKPVLTKTGDKAPITYQIMLDRGDTAFILMTMDISLASANPTRETLKFAYDAGRDGLLKTFAGSKLMSERDMTIDGKFGREILVHTNDYYLRYRFFAHGNRLYEAGVATALTRKDEPSLQAEFDRFFDSFQIFRGR